MFLILLVLASLLAGADTGAPVYTADSIVNPIAAVAGMYTPNSFITIYGSHLSYVTRAMGPDDLRAGTLPTVLTGTGVRVLINHVPANVYYVSPAQVNVLVPASLVAGPATIQLVNDGLAGPAVEIVLDPVAPAMFQLSGNVVLAAHLDGRVITADAPGRRGEVVVIYATGLGPTVPPSPSVPYKLSDAAAQIRLPNREDSTRTAHLFGEAAADFRIRGRIVGNAQIDLEQSGIRRTDARVEDPRGRD